MEFAKFIQEEKEEKSDNKSDKSLENQFTAEQAALAKIKAMHHHKDGSAVKLKVLEDDLSNSIQETKSKEFDSSSQPHYGDKPGFSGKSSVNVGCSCGQVMHANFDEKGVIRDLKYERAESGYSGNNSVSSGYQSNESSGYVR